MELNFRWLDENDEQNDEVCIVTLNGQHVITMDHGPHGWDGMVGIQEALFNCARLAGWTVEVQGEPGI